MEQEIRKILRCPICEKGRIADAPAGAALSQYRLFAMVGDEPADIIAKCPRCGMQVGITVRHRTADTGCSPPDPHAHPLYGICSGIN